MFLFIVDYSCLFSKVVMNKNFQSRATLAAQKSYYAGCSNKTTLFVWLLIMNRFGHSIL